MLVADNKYDLDTNILVYSLSSIKSISEVAINLITPNACVSNFVVQEFLFQLKKGHLKLDKKTSIKIVTDLLKILKLNRTDKDNYSYAHFLVNRYDFSLEDGMVVSDAILNNCNVLYSRDMQNGQIVDKKLKIIDPYK